MKKLYDEPAAYSTADIANALMQERDRKLPVRSSFFNALVPKVSAQDAAINRPDPVERASLFPFATYPDGSTKLAIPGMIAEDIPRAFTAPSRAYRGEIPDEDMISEGLNFAGNMAMTGSIAPKPTNAAGMFGGRLAKTADHAALARAEEMAAKGVPREDIWSQTGWFKGVDGKWRFEIDDSGATYNGAAPGQLKNLFDHNNLYAAYPQMKTWGVTPIDDVNVGAYYNSAQGAKRPIWAQLIDRVIGYNPHTIVTGPKNADKTTLLHELTHGVQDIEGVSMPSGSAYYSGDLKSYNNMANEVEARAVQKRMDLTPEQRSSRPPWLDYDVPESQQIVRFNANSSEAAAPGVVVSEAARQPLEVPFYRGSAHGQTSVDYSQPYWGVSHGIPDVAQKLASHYAKSRSGMYFNADTTPNVTPAVARFRNPLEVDAQNAGWSQIPFEGGTISTDKLADLAKERGHDGLVVNRLYDEGRVDEALGLPSTVAALRPGTVSSAFDPNNILYSNGAKSAAPGVLASEASKRVENPIRASHVSRADFDKFDFGKIGSGYGHLDEGHGLYFGQHKGLLDSYAKEFGPDAKRYDVAIHADESKFGDWDTLPPDIKAALKTERGARAAAQSGMPGVVVKHPEGNSYVVFDQSTPIDILTKYQNPDTAKAPGALMAEAADQSAPRVPNPIRAYHGSQHDFDRFDSSKIGTGEGAQAYGHGIYLAENEDVAKSYKGAGVRQQWSSLDPPDKKGHMYEVAIHADPNDFVDWDKPLSQQSEKVRERIPAIQEKAVDARRAAKGDLSPQDADYLRSPDLSVEDLARMFKGNPQALREAGIPGIRYLDQGSRAAGQGSSNYVVFDDALIEILRKYMNPKTAAAPGVLMVEGGKQ